MAEGVDQIAAVVAATHRERDSKSASAGAEIRLVAILPFALAEFEKDVRIDPNRPKEQSYRSDEEWREVNKLLRSLLESGVLESQLEIDDEGLIEAARPE